MPEKSFFLSVVYPYPAELLRGAERQLQDHLSIPDIPLTITEAETTLSRYLRLSEKLGINQPPRHVQAGYELEIYATCILLTRVALLEASEQGQAALAEYREGVWEVSGTSFVHSVRHDATAILAGAGDNTMCGAVILTQTGAPRSQAYDY